MTSILNKNKQECIIESSTLKMKESYLFIVIQFCEKLILETKRQNSLQGGVRTPSEEWLTCSPELLGGGRAPGLAGQATQTGSRHHS